MCTFFEKLEEEGVEKGRAEGRTEGYVEGRAEEIIDMGLGYGLSEDAILARLQKRLGLSLPEAKRYMDRFREQVVR